MSGEREVFVEGFNSMEEDEEFQKLVDETKLEENALQLPRGYLSISQLNTFLRCGLQYQYRYIDGLVSPPGISLVEGSAIHKGLEVILREKKDTGKVAPMSVLHDAWYDAWKEKKKDITDWGEDGERKTVRDTESRDVGLLSLYYQTKMPVVNPIEVEQRFWTSVGNNNIPVLGYIDMIDQDELDLVNGRSVVDHKVVKSSKSQADANNDPQLTLYAKVSHTDRVRFDCLCKTKTPKITTVASTRVPTDYLWLVKIFDKVAEAINAGTFMPADPTSWACSPRFCGYYWHCRGKGRKR